MQLLELDFQARRRSSGWIGRVLLVLAVAFGADVTVAYVHDRETVRSAEARLAQRSPKSAGPVQPVSSEEMRAAQQTLERLSLAWDNLFNALERSPGEDVSLLAIEPDARSGTALISGEAKDYAAVLHYVAKLGEAKTLKDVYLVRHEMRPAAGSRRPMVFSVSASWTGGR